MSLRKIVKSKRTSKKFPYYVEVKVGKEWLPLNAEGLCGKNIATFSCIDDARFYGWMALRHFDGGVARVRNGNSKVIATKKITRGAYKKIRFLYEDKNWFIEYDKRRRGYTGRSNGCRENIGWNRLQQWYRNGELHRLDGPAVVWNNGCREWYRKGKLHREDGPAIILFDGTEQWYRNGKHHREDGPAVVWNNGCREWYRRGKHHREDGPAIIHPNGTCVIEAWYINDELHRDEGPARVFADGTKHWYLYDNLIRVERSDGTAIADEFELIIDEDEDLVPVAAINWAKEGF